MDLQRYLFDFPLISLKTILRLYCTQIVKINKDKNIDWWFFISITNHRIKSEWLLLFCQRLLFLKVVFQKCWKFIEDWSPFITFTDSKSIYEKSNKILCTRVSKSNNKSEIKSKLLSKNIQYNVLLLFLGRFQVISQKNCVHLLKSRENILKTNWKY